MKKWVLDNEVMGLLKRMFGYCKWFYSHSPSCRERKKKGLKEKKRTGRMKKWDLGNEVMGLPDGCLGIYEMGNEHSGIYTMDNEYNEINININIIYKNLM